ncbi:hypothetical protein SEA_SIXAMA_6 [Gordonia phage Sixama]|uniref:Uncharacterized protein n=1 Tax=Gordonia phage Sixama TaxID=2653271 RepID=A0A5Q2F6V2_9CAUD|nr:hypothetical protein PP302_gp006 [Gordonia phage Sixama]QGF20185.1 hypothetical protein SEA_SIXAMA_6 [Gordonia phage Sixama]
MNDNPEQAKVFIMHESDEERRTGKYRKMWEDAGFEVVRREDNEEI